MTVAFANIFLISKIEKKSIINQSTTKPLVWKMYYDDIFCVQGTTKHIIEEFARRANMYHQPRSNLRRKYQTRKLYSFA